MQYINMYFFDSSIRQTCWQYMSMRYAGIYERRNRYILALFDSDSRFLRTVKGRVDTESGQKKLIEEFLKDDRVTVSISSIASYLIGMDIDVIIVPDEFLDGFHGYDEELIAKKIALYGLEEKPSSDVECYQKKVDEALELAEKCEEAVNLFRER